MRWNQQTIEAEQAQRLPGYRDPAVVRRFKAPEAMDVEFLEVRAKSALNRVPGETALPFRWTVNPYRGCAHACVYCLDGSTPILMADGSHRPLADLRVGDAIYGTKRRGAYRRFVRTEVLAHWSTVKPAYRVTLADGTDLVASADHRLLTTRGWSSVAGTGPGRDRRPHLTRGTMLMGAGAFDPGPDVGADHRSGYVCGATAVLRERSLDGRAVRTAAGLEVVSVEPLGEERMLYDITTGTGDFIANGVVSHNCFARPTHEFLDMDAGRDFERRIVVKVNAPEVLRAELARPSWKAEPVAMGTNTDPYQWVEGRYKLMRGIWDALRDARNPCSVLTKSPLILRDADLLEQIAAVSHVSASLSIPTLDERAWRATEPHTPHPRARLEAVAELNRRGIPTGVFIAPLMPGINDAPEQVEPLLQAAREAGAVSIGSNTLFLRGSVRELFLDWLRSTRPDLLERYEELYADRVYLSAARKREIQRGAGLASGAPRFRHRRAAADGAARAGTAAGKGRGAAARPEAAAAADERAAAPVQEALF